MAGTVDGTNLILGSGDSVQVEADAPAGLMQLKRNTSGFNEVVAVRLARASLVQLRKL